MLATVALYPHRTIPLAAKAEEDRRFLEENEHRAGYRFGGVHYDPKADYPHRWRVELQFEDRRLPTAYFARSAEGALARARIRIEAALAASDQSVTAA